MKKWVKGSVLGKGSFGTVSVASPLSDDNFNNSSSESVMVAVKSADIDSYSTLKREGKFLNQLRGCPELVSCFGEDKSVENGIKIYNLFLEYAPGGTLEDVMIKNGGNRFPELKVSCYAYMIMKGLSHIHGRGYVHCDLKPSNILVFPSALHKSLFHLKIADLGLAKKAGTPTTGPCCIDGKRYLLRGTPAYNPPESVMFGLHEAPMDIWAMGIILLQMLTGKTRYPDCENLDDLLEKIRFGKDFPQVPEYISEKAKDFLGMCLIRNNDKRWSADMLLKHPFIAENFLTKGDILRAKKVTMNPLAEGGAAAADHRWWFSGKSLFSTPVVLPPKPKKNCFLPHEIFAGALQVGTD